MQISMDYTGEYRLRCSFSLERGLKLINRHRGPIGPDQLRPVLGDASVQTLTQELL